MTKHDAHMKAQRKWCIGQGKRIALAVQRRKIIEDRCGVGYYEHGLAVVLGAGPTWEIAFERAEKREK